MSYPRAEDARILNKEEERGRNNSRRRDADKLKAHKSHQREAYLVKQAVMEENIRVSSKDEGSTPGRDTRRHRTTKGPPWRDNSAPYGQDRPTRNAARWADDM
jgi:hypothetical protein